jgi:hypothetical protein
MTDLVQPRKPWQLHMSTLGRHSSSFALALRKHVECGGDQGQWLYFLLAEEGGKIVLVEQARGGDQLTLGYGTSSSDPLSGHVLIKVEDTEDSTGQPVTQDGAVFISDEHEDVVGCVRPNLWRFLQYTNTYTIGQHRSSLACV